MQPLHDVYLKIFGADGHPTDLNFFHVCLRAFVIFAVGLAIVRIGDRRSLSEKTAFDAIFIVLLGSMLSRAINGTAPFIMTIVGAFVLMFIHRICAYFAFRSHRFGNIIKGNETTLVQDGQIDWKTMGRKLVSKHDLEEDMRLSTNTDDISKIRIARLERSGDISFIKGNGG